MFSGLVRCGCCGATYTIWSQDNFACTAHRARGTCTNNRTVRVPDLEHRVLDGIKQRLLAPVAIAEFLAERKRLNARMRRDRH